MVFMSGKLCERHGFQVTCAVLNEEVILYIFIYLLQLGCYPVAVVILHVNKT